MRVLILLLVVMAMMVGIASADPGTAVTWKDGVAFDTPSKFADVPGIESAASKLDRDANYFGRHSCWNGPTGLGGAGGGGGGGD